MHSRRRSEPIGTRSVVFGKLSPFGATGGLLLISTLLLAHTTLFTLNPDTCKCCIRLLKYPNLSWSDCMWRTLSVCNKCYNRSRRVSADESINVTCCMCVCVCARVPCMCEWKTHLGRNGVAIWAFFFLKKSINTVIKRLY